MLFKTQSADKKLTVEKAGKLFFTVNAKLIADNNYNQLMLKLKVAVVFLFFF